VSSRLLVRRLEWPMMTGNRCPQREPLDQYVPTPVPHGRVNDHIGIEPQIELDAAGRISGSR